MVCELLSEVGIRSRAQMTGGGIGLGALTGGIGLGAAASRDVHVEEQDYDKALEVLNATVPSEEELARLSDEAGEGRRRGHGGTCWSRAGGKGSECAGSLHQASG